MVIINPQLPPKEGYVEIEVNGVRQYKKIITETDIKLQEQESINASLMLEIAKLKVGV